MNLSLNNFIWLSFGEAQTTLQQGLEEEKELMILT